MPGRLSFYIRAVTLMVTSLMWLSSPGPSFAQSTSFTYQGKLFDGGVPANGLFDFQCKLFDMLAAGAQQGATVTLDDVTVADGSFTVLLDFGASVFTGADRFLEIGVRPGADTGAYTLLGPRQQLTSTPYAIRSLASTSADSLSLACVGCVQDSQINTVTGSKIVGQIPTASVPAGSGNYIQNTNVQQAASNFNISGDGIAGGTLSASSINAVTQYYISGSRVLSVLGLNNVFAGVGAGQSNTTGAGNSFVGDSAGLNNTSGANNAFFGRGAGQANTTGASNAFYGQGAGSSNTTGGGGAFFGQGAGQANTTGFVNAFFGAAAGSSNTTGGGNAFFGAGAGLSNTTASNNSFFGVAAGSSNTSGADNAFFGQGAGQSNMTASNNAFFGVRAGQSNTIASNNAFFGALAGSSNTNGEFNAFFGQSAGFLNTTGSSNSFFGQGAGQYCTTCDSNSFFGYRAGENNTRASRNSFFGYRAGANNVTGDLNAFFGESAGLNNSTGDQNAFFGTQAGSFNVSGVGNAFFGISAGDSNTSGNLNTLIGNDTDVGSGSLTNATAIGQRAFVTASNSLVLGSINGVNNATANTNVGIGTTAPIDRLDVAGNIRIGFVLNGCVRDRDGTVIAGTCSSDLRFKRDVTPFPPVLDALTRLRPVHFYWRSEEYPDQHFGTSRSFGLIAQEVEKVMPELVSEDEQGYKVVRYNELPFVMLQAIKDLKAENEELKQSWRTQKAESDGLRRKLAEQDRRLRRIEAKLGQQ